MFQDTAAILGLKQVITRIGRPIKWVLVELFNWTLKMMLVTLVEKMDKSWDKLLGAV